MRHSLVSPLSAALWFSTLFVPAALPASAQTAPELPRSDRLDFGSVRPDPLIREIYTTLQERLSLVETISVRGSRSTVKYHSEESRKNIREDWPDFLRRRVAATEVATTREMFFRAKGEKFRIILTIQHRYDDEIDPAKTYESAYDENHYQRMSDDGYLKTSKGRLAPYDYLMTPTFMTMFEFVYSRKDDDDQFTLSRLAAPETWADAAEFSSVLGENVVDGHICVVVDVKPNDYSGQGQTAIKRVYFSKDMGYFPIRIEYLREDGGLLARSIAKNIRRFEAPNGSEFYLHENSVVESFSNQGAVLGRSEDWNDFSEFEFNIHLPDSMFTIPRASKFTTPIALATDREQAPTTAADTLEKSRARAAGEGKLLFVQFSTPTCGWCKRLDAFLDRDAVKSIFEKYYIKAKIDQQTMKDGTALRRELSEGLGGGGVPWFAILNDKREVLITSSGPKGNIGYPLEPDGAAYFMRMLERTAPKMTSEERTTIESELQLHNDAT